MKLWGSLTGKLWLSMLVLVLLALALSAVVQSRMLESIYFKQQEVRLLDEGDRLAKLIAAETDSSTVTQEIHRTADYLRADIIVVNQAGLVEQWYGGMYHMRGMMRGRQMPPFNQRDVRQVLEGEIVLRRGFNPYLEQELLSAAMPITRGEEHTVAGALFISAPLAPIAANVRALQQAVLLALAGGIVLATGLSLLLSRGLARPLLEMNALARKMAAGDYSTNVPVRSKDEVGRLAVSLNQLAAELKSKVEQLERLDKNRREFVGAVSHELRTPLTVIQGYTEAISDGLVRDQALKEKYLGYMQDEIRRLRKLVDELLDVSRIEAGKLAFSPGPVDLNAITVRVLDKYRPVAEVAGVDFNLMAEADLPVVQGDPDRLEQVFLNLLDNAIRYTPPGGKVWVGLKPVGKYVEVAVRDTGHGIPEAEMPLIWERFYKADKARTRTDAGSGLGLSIAKNIVTLHNGYIGVKNHPEGGCVFTVKLPI